MSREVTIGLEGDEIVFTLDGEAKYSGPDFDKCRRIVRGWVGYDSTALAQCEAAIDRLCRQRDPVDLAFQRILAGKITIAFGHGVQDNLPDNVHLTRGELVTILHQKIREGGKDGQYMLQGSTAGGRNAKAMDALYLWTADIENGDDEVYVEQQIRKAGLLGVIYHTHSHSKTRTEISEEKFKQHKGRAEAAGGGAVDVARLFFRSEKKWRPHLVDSITEVIYKRGADGKPTFEVAHGPMPRLRVVLFLEEPFEFMGNGKLQSDRIEDWKVRYMAVAAKLQLVVDKSCCDPARLMYTPSHAKGTESPRVWAVKGKLLELPDACVCQADSAVAATGAAVTPGTFEPVTVGLMKFLALHEKHFDAVAFFEDDREPRHRYEDGRCEFACPNEGGHTNPHNDDRAFVVWPAKDGRGFDLFCHHNGCQHALGKCDRAQLLDAECQARGISDATDLLPWCSGQEAVAGAERKMRSQEAFRLTVDKPTGPVPKRRLITIRAGLLNENVAQAGKALGEQGLSVFQRGNELVSTYEAIIDADKGRTFRAVRLSRIELTSMRLFMNEAALWEKPDAKGFLKPTDCPRLVAEAYLGSPSHWRDLRVLNSIVHTPVLRPDGTLLDRPGYDSATGLIYDPLGIDFPPISKMPSEQDALAALELLNELLVETPFISDAAKSVALSAIITAMVRPAMATAPLHAATAPVAGTGKSFLWDLVALIATGKPAPVVPQGANNEELEKRLFAGMLRGDSIVNIDNCDRPLGGAFLNLVLTQVGATNRILGQSKMMDVPPNVTLLATGNNLEVSDDMPRRVLLCRLDSRQENPEFRKFDQNPKEMVSKNRARYVAAVLTILRAYEVCGRPARQNPLGSFEAWSHLVRDALVWLGEADPVSTVEEARSSNPERVILLSVLTQWRRVFHQVPITVGEVIQRAKNDTELRHALHAVAATMVRSDEIVCPRRLGNYLSKHQGRVVEGMKFEKGPVHTGLQQWVLRSQ
jgi:hypothetical protein